MVIKDIAHAKSRISISFDGQKANNNVLNLLGIVAHYIDRNGKLNIVTLALRDTYRFYTSKNMKDHLLAVLREYQISNKVAFFAANNATNNNKALRLFATELNLDLDRQRLCCLNYVLNLVSIAILYSIDKDYVDKVLQAVNKDADTDSKAVSSFVQTMASKDKTARLKAWRKKGPVSKLNTLIVHIKYSNSRRVFFESKQREAANEGCRLY